MNWKKKDFNTPKWITEPKRTVRIQGGMGTPTSKETRTKKSENYIPHLFFLAQPWSSFCALGAIYERAEPMERWKVFWWQGMYGLSHIWDLYQDDWKDLLEPKVFSWWVPLGFSEGVVKEILNTCLKARHISKTIIRSNPRLERQDSPHPNRLRRATSDAPLLVFSLIFPSPDASGRRDAGFDTESFFPSIV